jgi:outer membrane protein OmpA-like peptidoglycan-associated protein/opacity protein-like surface antigen
VKKVLVLSFVIFMSVSSVMAQVTEKLPYIGIHSSAINLLGGEEPNDWKAWTGAQIGYYFNKRIGLELSGSYGWSRPEYVTDDEDYITYLYPISLSMKYNFKEDARFTPYGLLGVGLLQWDLRNVTGDTTDYKFLETIGDRVYSQEMKDVFIVVGGGAHYFLSKYFSLEGGLRFNYIVDHGMDINGFGGNQYGIIEGRLGFNFHFQKVKDSDGDGIFDNLDMAIMDPEDFDGFEDEDGAPDFDNDNDGVLDADDGKPNVPEDMDGFEDEDGVPDLDNDGDGLPDDKDKSPNVAEDFDGFEDEDGAPDLDNDGDGILDINDACPNKPETKNGYMDNDGCPDKKPVEKPVVKTYSFKGVTFRNASDYLTLESKAILDKAVEALKANPNMKLVINGYTDNVGSRDINMDLSKYRANSVKKYLVSMGVSESRLSTNGYGSDSPVASNDTAVGRAKNRRIEFIVEY